MAGRLGHGGDDLLQSFVDAGTVDDTLYAVPYYSGARAVFYDKELFAAAGVEVPTTLAEFTEVVQTLQQANPTGQPSFSGFRLPGQDWYNGVAWLNSHGGELALEEDGEWAGVDLVMTAHVVFPALDTAPATLSRRLLVDVLRGELGFTGVVVTDALDMAGVRAAHGLAGAAVLSLAAGADLLLVGAEDGAEHCAAIRAAVRAAVTDGTLVEARLRDAAARVTALRQRLAAAERPEPPVTDPDTGRAAARAALQSRGVAPLTGPADVAGLRAETDLAVGDAAWSLARPLAEDGLLAGLQTVTEGGVTAEGVAAAAAGRPLVVAVRDAHRSPWQTAWLDRLRRARPDLLRGD